MINVWDLEIANLNRLQDTDKAMRAALTSVLATQKKRVFQSGQDASQTKIGRYSTKTTSIAKKQQAVQTGKTYFKGGYAEYKSLIGKNPGFVTLRNTDQMMMDYGMFVLGKGQYGLGFANEVNFNKSGWMEDKYKKDIFAESQDDAKVFETVLSAYIDRSMQ